MQYVHLLVQPRVYFNRICICLHLYLEKKDQGLPDHDYMLHFVVTFLIREHTDSRGCGTSWVTVGLVSGKEHFMAYLYLACSIFFHLQYISLLTKNTLNSTSLCNKRKVTNYRNIRFSCVVNSFCPDADPAGKQHGSTALYQHAFFHCSMCDYIHDVMLVCYTRPEATVGLLLLVE